MEILNLIGIIILIGIGAVIAVAMKSDRFDKNIKEFESKLLALSRNLQSREPAVLRDIIVQSDSLLAKSLQIRFGNKSSCGENLKKVRHLFNKKAYDQLWDMHRLRNQIVHEQKDVGQREAQEAYRVFKTAIYKILQ